MTLTKPFPTQDPAGHPITDTRRVLGGLIARNADGTSRPGILPPAATALVTGRADMAYDVAPFVAATSRFSNGVELVANDAATKVDTDPAPSSNSRIDVIWVRSQFLQHTDGSNLAVFGVTKGVAAPTPAKPAIPAGALELAWATVPSTATTTLSNGVVITQTYPYTAAAGGVVLLRTIVERDAWATPAEGQRVHVISTKQSFTWVAGAWRLDAEDTGWTAPALQNNWVNLDGGFQSTRYRRLNGMVHVEGHVKSGNTGVATFVLPPGFRPLAIKIYVTPANAGVADVRVLPNGTVYVAGFYAGGSNGVVGLNLPPFPAEA